MRSEQLFLTMCIFTVLLAISIAVHSRRIISRIDELKATVAENATVEPDPACSVQTTTVGGEEVTRGSLEVDGVVEDGAYYPYADCKGIDIYLPNQDGYEFCERGFVWEITRRGDG